MSSTAPRASASRDRVPSEFDLIARLTANLRATSDVVLGVGDDAAILDWQPGRQLVVTCDAQVEGTHFIRTFSSPDQIGRRALTVNLSDVAAMGGTPRFALVSLIVSPTEDAGWLDQVYAGIRAQADHYGVSIIGGNIATTTGPTCIDITLIGSVPEGGALRRDGGHAGDRVYVSGQMGAAVAGLATLRQEVPEAPAAVLPAAVLPAAVLDEVRAAYRDPQPRIALGQALAATGAVTAMIDVSDGLSSDLHHLCQQSHVGAIIDEEALPISPATRRAAEALSHSPVDWALHGGDAYQLLFAVSPDREDHLAALSPELRGQIHPIGWLTSRDAGITLRRADGSSVELPPRGWDHLIGDNT